MLKRGALGPSKKSVDQRRNKYEIRTGRVSNWSPLTYKTDALAIRPPTMYIND